jgi:uncharacterized protein YbcC (UPF0753/DUF2309 family)
MTLAVKQTQCRTDAADSSPLSADEFRAVVEKTCLRIAPLWPLDSFVAVNPFLGLSDMSFAAASARLHRLAKRQMLMPRAFYLEALQSGHIVDADLDAALQRIHHQERTVMDLAAFKHALAHAHPANDETPAAVATIAETLDRLAGGNRQVSRTAFMIDEISKWCAGYFDQGQALWPSPWRHLPLYQAWREASAFDRNPETMGIKGFRRAVAALPGEPLAAIREVLERLDIPPAAYEDYLHRALLDIGGWAAYARYRVWMSGLEGQRDDTLIELLAIRVVWGYALYLEHDDALFRTTWQEAMAAARRLAATDVPAEGSDLLIDLILQEAYEHAYQRELIAAFALACPPAQTPAEARPALQAAFCIDVRSEPYRRALETILPQAQTIGFAGFFGVPFAFQPLAEDAAQAQCPVLLKPVFTIGESLANADAHEQRQVLQRLSLKARLLEGWISFKRSAVSCFTYVETAGFLAALALIRDGAALSRRAAPRGLAEGVVARLKPNLDPGPCAHGSLTGILPAARLDLAEGLLRAMSLTKGFAPLVLLVGHGSTTVNNPHAAGLQCGACGGHNGAVNARVAAAILNDGEVRRGLGARGILVPDDTWFIAALHDTTTDRLTLFDLDLLPEAHRPGAADLHQALAKASALTAYERAFALGVPLDEGLSAAIARRSRDWSQVRPEWGLAGNAAFIVAPRARSHCLDLGGRAFLHSYSWQQDAGFRVLEQIMTAPMIVASWINLQYYGSVVNNVSYGSGNKVLHNIVGGLGVLEGNAGDLRTGLPAQSLHDGKALVHKPLRLSVIIEAPLDAINAVIAKHESVRQLTDNHWLHLFALAEDGRIKHRYLGEGQWQSLS